MFMKKINHSTIAVLNLYKNCIEALIKLNKFHVCTTLPEIFLKILNALGIHIHYKMYLHV